MTEPERDDKDQLWSEATHWFARMRSPDAEEFRAEFEEWLARGALHRRYYNRASEHWLHGTIAYAEERAQLRSADAPAPEPPPPPRRVRTTVIGVVAASIVVAATGLVVLTYQRGPDAGSGPSVTGAQPPIAQDRVATARNEQRAVRLADGSLVRLKENTWLSVDLSKATRRLTLGRGQAEFDVAHEARPFVVFAGGASVTAHGTVFDVALTADRRVSVRLIKGSVDVRYPATRAIPTPLQRRLRPGESVSFAVVAAPSDQAIVAPSPPSGELARDYREVRLTDIVGEANRHATVPIRFADPATGAQRVSGRFVTGDTNVLAERIAGLFDLTVDRSSADEIVLRPR